VSKRLLDVAIHGEEPTYQAANDAAGYNALITWLRAHGAGRVGLEATGGYERALCAALVEAGFEVVLHQPLEVRLFARLRRLRAKNDRLDAQLIACATAQVETVRAIADPHMASLAERLTAYEQASQMATLLKTTMEHLTLADLIADAKAQLAELLARKMRLARDLIARIKAEPSLAPRFALLSSLPGFGPVVAMGIVIRMPELGDMQHGQAASLLGVAPFDRDSGPRKGQRYIAGGRARARRLIYLAAIAAKRWDPSFKAFAQRLSTAGKPPKVIVVAVMRKLIEAANTVLKRQLPWTKSPQPT
jgi:transposase